MLPPIWVGPITKRKTPHQKIKNQNVKRSKKTQKKQPKNDDKKIEEQIAQKPSNSEKFDPESSAKTVDYVLVFQNQEMKPEHYQKLENFVMHVEQRGLNVEIEKSQLDETIAFVKLHASLNLLLEFAEIFEIDLNFQNVSYKVRPKPPKFQFMETILTRPNIEDPVFLRARDIILETTPKTITNAEKGLLISKILSIIPYGPKKHQYGIDNLIEKKIFLAAFPLHDGPYEWSEEGPLNERQLLAKYWSTFRCWNKQQPLDLVEKYFGPEAAFYFAWLGFYNKMLVPIAILGTLVFVVGSSALYGTFTERNDDVCTSDKMMCPKCLHKVCKYAPLRHECSHVKVMSFFDNFMVLSFSGIMTIWGIIYVIFWIREQYVLQFRWNLRYVQIDYSMRPTFAENTKFRRISIVTGLEEPYIPKKIIFRNYLITFFIIQLMIVLMILGIFAIIVYSQVTSVALAEYNWLEGHGLDVGLVVSITASTISVIFIFIWDKIYHKLAMFLTNLENPRTQIEFDNSYTYKAFLITFVNNFSAIFYIAFFKNKFYTYPGDADMWEKNYGMRADQCDIGCCMTELGIQLLMVMLVKNFIMTVKQYLLPVLLLFVNKLRHKRAVDVRSLPQWEQDFLLNPMDKNGMMGEYMEMVIQYCFVIFFSVVFPPTPLLAFLNNIVELRVDAFKLVMTQRRPVARKVATIPAWTNILLALTFFAAIVNYITCTYTSGWMERIYYRRNYDFYLKGFLDFILSAYNTSEYPIVMDAEKNVTRCFYPGLRYPPEHQLRYEQTEDYWIITLLKGIQFFSLEIATFFVLFFLSNLIPQVPFVMKEHINYHKEQVKKIQFQGQHVAYMQSRQNVNSVVFEELLD